MRSHIYSALAFVIILVSCKSKEPAKEVDDLMFVTYHKLDSLISTRHLDSIPLLLTPKSKDFYHKITDPKNLNLDSIISIGIRYRVPYFAMKYLGSCGDHMKSTDDPLDFFRYLAAKDISIFPKEHGYTLYKEESRIENAAWIAISRKDKGVNKVNWIKLVKSERGTYQYDLIYNLKLEERINRKIFKNQRKKHLKLSDEEFIEMYYPTFDKQECEI